MQKGNLISVIIPTYNHYDRDIGLSDLVESLLSTPNEELIGEIIIVDNGNSLVVDELESVNEKIRVVSEIISRRQLITDVSPAPLAMEVADV